jgi:oxygen-dependent protoporphyrinogen oxidase
VKWAVVGGGIAGLAHGFALLSRGHEVTVFEAAPRSGGNIRTERDGGYSVEWGPNGFLDNVPATFEFVRRLGIGESLLCSSDAARVRWLFRRGRLLRLPESPPAFFASPLLSPFGRARVLLEPLARGRPRHDETVHAFASRRIGREAADVLVSAMVSGVFAGDARRLSLRSAFPKMHAMEAAHGSLFRALIARRRAGTARGGPAGPGGVLTSFRGGMEDLVAAFAARLGERLRLSTPVTGLSRRRDGWVLDGPGEEAEGVVLACPAPVTSRLLRPLAPEAAARLGRVRGASIAVVGLAFDEAALGGPPAGFGFLAPPGEGLRILGCLFDSSVYPGHRAPPGKVLLRAMIGGALDPGAVDLDDGALLATARADLRKAMGLRADPERHWIFRFPRGIPQYEPGHGLRLAEAARMLAPWPTLRLAGNSYRGISVNSCLEEAAPLLPA